MKENNFVQAIYLSHGLVMLSINTCDVDLIAIVNVKSCALAN